MRRGRARGFVPWLITQRLAVLHKDVLSKADILVSMKFTSSQDRARHRPLDREPGGTGRRPAHPGRPAPTGPGEGWVWAPSHGVLAQVGISANPQL